MRSKVWCDGTDSKTEEPQRNLWCVAEPVVNSMTSHRVTHTYIYVPRWENYKPASLEGPFYQLAMVEPRALIYQRWSLLTSRFRGECCAIKVN